MRDDVLGIPDQIRDAIWRIDTAQPKSHAVEGLLVVGMGGSAIGANLARDILDPHLSGQFTVWRDYGIPPGIGPSWAMLASSYSGNTEETLSAFEAASAAGIHRWVTGTGGALAKRAREESIEVIGLPGLFQPRAAVVYMTIVAMYAANLAGIAPDQRSELEASADFLERNRDRLSELAVEFSAVIGDLPVVVYGADLTVSLARRWANQLNENAKQSAYPVSIPEANHNLTESWGNGSGKNAAVVLLDRDQHPRNRTRLGFSRNILEETGTPVLSVECEGESRSDRILWGVMLGDLVSLEVARRRGVDPKPVDRIEDLKRRLENTS